MISGNPHGGTALVLPTAMLEMRKVPPLISSHTNKLSIYDGSKATHQKLDEISLLL